jgi:hypothetical protein
MLAYIPHLHEILNAMECCRSWLEVSIHVLLKDKVKDTSNSGIIASDICYMYQKVKHLHWELETVILVERTDENFDKRFVDSPLWHL